MRRVLIPGTMRATAHPFTAELRDRIAAVAAGTAAPDPAKAAAMRIQRENAKAAKRRRPRRRGRMTGPKLCGAQHPDFPAYTCGGEIKKVDGKDVGHRGDHRARPLVGIVIRWAA